MKRLLFRLALGFVGLLSGPAMAQQAEGEWRVLERPKGAILVRLFGYETDTLPDYFFECVSGRKTITARTYETYTLSEILGTTPIDALLVYAPDARTARGCDGKCRMIMDRFGAMSGDKPWRPSQFAVGTTSFKKLSAGFKADIMSDNWEIYSDKLPEVRRVWRARLSIFKRRCRL